jgi:starch-binding outer membrane protein, SusD/RagB family
MTRLTGQNDSPANWKVIRYADVLLMLAEALNENNKTDEALGYLNQVRERAGLEKHTGLSQSDTREMIYLERRFELFAEGHRWFDLVRTGRALEVMQPYGMLPHMTVFPIPLSQIEVMNNPPVVPQNPGYN